MQLGSKSSQQKFPFEYQLVYSELLAVMQKLGMTIKTEDKVIGRITATTGVSWHSWGEKLTIVVENLGEKQTLIAMESSPKTGIATANKHQQNFEKIIDSLSKRLQSIQ